MSGNGVDLAAIYQAIVLQGRKIEALTVEVSRLDRKIDGLKEALSGDVHSLSNKIDNYHMSVVGHGIMLTEHEERIVHLEHRASDTGE